MRFRILYPALETRNTTELPTFFTDDYLVKDIAEGLIKNRAAVLDGLGGKAGIIVLPMPMANFGLRLSVKTKWEGTVVTNWGTFSFVG